MGKSEEKIKCAQTKIPVRRSDGRVFKMPVAAAWSLRYENGVEESVIEVGTRIYYACEGMIKEVHGYTYEWAPEMIGKYVMARAEKVEPEFKLPQVGPETYSTYYKIKHFVDSHPELLVDWFPVTYITKYEEFPGNMTVVLGRHMVYFVDVYKTLLGLEMSRFRDDEAVDIRWQIKKTGPTSEETFEDFVKRNSSKKKVRRVRDLDSGILYRTVDVAHVELDIPKEMLVLNCFGDIPYVDRHGKIWHFAWELE